MIDLDEIERALAAATPGKRTWEAFEDAYIPETVFTAGGDVSCHGYRREANAHLVSNAPHWLAELVAEVRQLRNAPMDVQPVIDLLDRAKGAVAEVERLRAALDVARRGLADIAGMSSREARDGVPQRKAGRIYDDTALAGPSAKETP